MLNDHRNAEEKQMKNKEISGLDTSNHTESNSDIVGVIGI